MKKIIKEEVSDKEGLKALLKSKLPGMFDRNPEITGDLDKLAEDIINHLG